MISRGAWPSDEPDDERPEPPVPPDADLSNFRHMALDVPRLRKSKSWLIAKRRPELGFYMMNLWTAAWHEVPAGSLEDDDDALADQAMCDPHLWAEVKDLVMRGWTRCSDGRLYHPVVAETVLRALDAKHEGSVHRQRHADKMRAWRAAKAAKAAQQAEAEAANPLRKRVKTTVTPRDSHVPSRGSHVTSLKGREGKGKEERRSEESKQHHSESVLARERVGPNVTVTAPPPRPAPDPSPPPPPLPEATARGFALNRSQPALSDPPHAWETFADEVELIEDPKKPNGPIRNPLVNGQPIRDIARDLCRAIGLTDPSWRMDWSLLAAWLRDGYEPDRQIIPTARDMVEHMSGKPDWRGVSSLRLFERAIRAQAPQRMTKAQRAEWLALPDIAAARAKREAEEQQAALARASVARVA